MKVTINSITSGYIPVSLINANFLALQTALENTVSRDGTSPNTMLANLDMNSFRVINLLDATAAQDPVTLAQLTAVVAGTSFPVMTADLNMQTYRILNLPDAVLAQEPATKAQLDAVTLVVGTDVQAYSANLTEFATVNPSVAGLAILDDVDAAAQLTTLGVTAAAQTILDDATVGAIRTTLDVPSKSEAILDTLIDAAGDILIGTAADTVARLAIGAIGTRLLSNGTTAAWEGTWFKAGTFTRDVSAADASVATTGVGFTPKLLILIAGISGVPGAFSIGFSDGTTYGYMASDHLVSAGSFINGATSSLFFRPAGDNSQNTSAVVTSFDADGFTLTWTKSAGSTGTATIQYLAFR